MRASFWCALVLWLGGSLITGLMFGHPAAVFPNVFGTATVLIGIAWAVRAVVRRMRPSHTQIEERRVDADPEFRP